MGISYCTTTSRLRTTKLLKKCSTETADEQSNIKWADASNNNKRAGRIFKTGGLFNYGFKFNSRCSRESGFQEKKNPPQQLRRRQSVSHFIPNFPFHSNKIVTISLLFASSIPSTTNSTATSYSALPVPVEIL